MAFDPKLHAMDPVTGFMVDKETGQMAYVQPKPVVSPPVTEYPKWVPVHESYIVRKKTEGAPDHVSVTGYSDFHVNRVDGVVTVLVADEDAEKAAGAAFEAAPLPTIEPAAPVADNPLLGPVSGLNDSYTGQVAAMSRLNEGV